jgi:hypothetical protein
VHDAFQVLIDECWRGCRWVVETDIADRFPVIPHDRVMQALEERICDQPVLKLLHMILRAGVCAMVPPAQATSSCERGWQAVKLWRSTRSLDDGPAGLRRYFVVSPSAGNPRR